MLQTIWITDSIYVYSDKKESHTMTRKKVTEKTGVKNEQRQFDEVFINGICNHMEHV